MRFMKSTLLFILSGLFFALVMAGCSSESHSPTTSQASHSPIQLPATAQEIESLQQQATTAWNADITRIESEQNPTFDNTVHALNDALYDLNKIIGIASTSFYLSPSEEVRTAADQAYLSCTALRRQVYFNTQLYQALAQTTQESLSLNSTDQRLLLKLTEAFERNGIALSDSDKTRFNAINDEIDALESQFQSNVTNDQSRVVFTPEQLQGVPEDTLELMEQTEDGDYIFTATQYSQYNAIVTFAEHESSRRQAYIAYYSVAKEQNPAILERLIQLRAEKAALLGYDSYADFQIAPRMAKTAATAKAFMEQISTGTADKLAAEKNLLLDLKRSETADPTAQLYLWDMAFDINRYSAEHFDLDHSAMKKYFSLPVCLQGMFDTVADLFGLEIVPYTDDNFELWHSDVQCYEIREKSSGNALGLFYLDLYPRTGKYTWFASDFTYKGNSYRDGSRELPSGILIGNWTKPTSEQPSLLSFNELRDLFHEFGHILNLILMDTTYAELHETPWDFIEVPSQMLEQWCYDQRVLERFAVNYDDPDDVLPSDYVTKVEQAAGTFRALDTTSRYLTRGMIDLTLHTDYGSDDAVDVDAVYKEITERYFSPYPEEATAIARFEHLAGGYDAGYYSYLWSLAIVHDLKSRFDQTADGLLDTETVAALKEQIYQTGFNRDSAEVVHEFLGRDWSVDAYLEFVNSAQ